MKWTDSATVALCVWRNSTAVTVLPSIYGGAFVLMRWVAEKSASMIHCIRSRFVQIVKDYYTEPVHPSVPELFQIPLGSWPAGKWHMNAFYSASIVILEICTYYTPGIHKLYYCKEPLTWNDTIKQSHEPDMSRVPPGMWPKWPF